MRLRAVFGDYPETRALLRGEVQSPDLTLDFAKVSGRLPFKDFVRENKFDVGELPLIPLIQARELGKPLVLLPVVLVARQQHGSFYVRADAPAMTPKDLEGSTIALRSDANTGVAWALGILADEYGVDISRFRIVDFEDNHIAEYRSPARVERAPPGGDIVQLLADRKVDAIISEADMSSETRVRPLFADPAAEARRWFEKRRILPAGHVVAISAPLSSAHPDLARGIFDMLRQSRVAAGAESRHYPFGADAMSDTLTLMIDYALSQGLITRRLTVDELYDDATRVLRAQSQ